MPTIKQSLQAAIQQLTNHTDTPDLDAAILFSYALQKPRIYIHAQPEAFIETEKAQQFQQLITRRLHGEPIAYIIGKKEFWSFDLTVTTDTLIPRPETELLVETVLNEFNTNDKCQVADLGTGCGAIAIALASERSQWMVFATDKSEAALTVAKENAKRLHIHNIKFCLGDWLSALPSNKFNVIVSNPPYVTQEEWAACEVGVKQEPRQALVAGEQGLADIAEIISTAKEHLKIGGALFLEHGYKQGAKVRELFVSYGYTRVETVRDLAGHERVTLGRYFVV